MRAGAVLRLCARPVPLYQQGQRPEPGIREYFYYVDHNGRLFLDDAKVKNFATCFKDVAFLSFFFQRLQPNLDGRYASRFPFVSRCGRERNFLRCCDVPVVFTAVLPDPRGGGGFALSYCGGGPALTEPFQPRSLTVLPENGRLYHAAPERVGGAGLVSAALAESWSSALRFEDGLEKAPTHFWWRGKSYRLRGELLGVLRERRRRFAEISGEQ